MTPKELAQKHWDERREDVEHFIKIAQKIVLMDGSCFGVNCVSDKIEEYLTELKRLKAEDFKDARLQPDKTELEGIPLCEKSYPQFTTQSCMYIDGVWQPKEYVEWFIQTSKDLYYKDISERNRLNDSLKEQRRVISKVEKALEKM